MLRRSDFAGEYPKAPARKGMKSDTESYAYSVCWIYVMRPLGEKGFVKHGCADVNQGQRYGEPLVMPKPGVPFGFR